MEFVLTLLHGLAEVKFAMLAMTEKTFFPPLVFTAVIAVIAIPIGTLCVKFKSAHEKLQ